MNCTSCDRVNPDGARFCNQCGTALETRCGSCSQVNPPESRFCNHCGADLAGAGATAATRAQAREQAPRDYTPRHLADKILRNKAALEGERKHVTVLFADLADSTELAELLGPEEMHSLMDRAFQRILAQVHRFEGTVNQFTGDGVMALFGAPLALEDAPRRAVIAALGIHRELEALDQDLMAAQGRRFQMRIGINTGPVVVGKIGDDLRMDYTAVGDTTNFASRLEHLAPAGGIVVSQATRRLVEGFFDLEALEPTAVKGKSGTIQAYQVVAERPVSDRIEALTEAQLTPFIGRASELEALCSAFESARTGRGQVAFIVGEAGIGKSRLLHEFRRGLGDTPHDWFEGRCASFARTTPFHALVDGIRRRVGIDDRDNDDAMAAKLEQAETDAGGDLAWTLPFLRQLLSLPTGDDELDALDSMTRRSESSRALRARFLRTSGEPLVVVIEDLHWIDTASEEFLGFLADSIAATPLLLIFTHRPEYEQPFGDRSFHVRIPLQALSNQAMTEMVRSVMAVGELPAGLQELISGKAEGNPLFIEEVVRSLLEEGVIRLEGRVPYLARDLAAIQVPDRIQDVLMARLDRLSEGPKSAIQIASVIGREFALRLLERITETGGRLDSIVGELRALELIYEKSSYPELAYMFKHALTHDVAYESVLVQRRKTLHGLVGTAIEELYSERLPEHYEALAHHFGKAEDWEPALRYHELASEKSATAHANHAAADHCRSALAIADRLGEEVSLERRGILAQRLAASCWSVSEFRESGEAFDRAAAYAEEPSSRALLLARAGFSYLWNHDYEHSTARNAQAAELAAKHSAPAAAVYTVLVRDLHDAVFGNELASETDLERATTEAEHCGIASVHVQLLQQLGLRADWRGDFRLAIDMTQKAVDVAARNRRPEDALFGLWFLAKASTAVGDYTRGFELLDGGLQLSDQIGDRAIKARMLNTLGWCHAEIGCHALAAQYNRMGTDLAREIVDLGLVAGAPELYANAAINLAGNMIALGEPGAAEEQLAAVQEQRDTDKDPWMQWRWSLHLLDAQARLELLRGDADAALATADREIQATQQRTVHKIAARALELRGRILVTMDRREEAEASLRQALELATRIEHPPVTWRALSLLGEVAKRNAESDSAQRYFGELRKAVERTALAIPRAELRSEFKGLAERLASTPTTAYR